MPRFSMKGMLIVFAVVALWFSSIYIGGQDVRHSIVLMILSASGIKAYCSNGRIKCFWLAFSFALFMTVVYQSMPAPRMGWTEYTLQPLVTSVDIYGGVQTPGPSERKLEFIAETAKLVVDFFLATAAGFIGLSIYDKSQRNKS